jgi:DNA-binding PadR family transcriptional regulator
MAGLREVTSAIRVVVWRFTLAEAILLDLYANQGPQHPIQIASRLAKISKRRITPSMVRARMSELRHKGLVDTSWPLSERGKYELTARGEEYVETAIAPKFTDDELNLFG